MVVIRTISLAVAIVLAITTSHTGLARANSFGMVEDGWETHVRSAVLKIADTNFDEGLAMLDEYIAATPKSPSGYFYYAVGLQEQIQKLNDFSLMPRFSKYAKQCQRLARQALRKDKNDSVSRLFIAATDGYIGMLEARQRNLLSAFKNGIEARRGLERVMKERPDIPDTYFGLGMIYYFSSKKGAEEGGVVSWIIKKFITGGRDMHDEGIDMLRTAINQNALSADYAKSSLMWIYLYDHQYEQAEKLALEVAGKFEHDTLSRWVLGRVALVENRCDDAKEMFEKVESINAQLDLPGSDFPELPVAIKKAEVCTSMKEKDFVYAYKLNREVLSWLDSEPKITLEYQDEKNLLKSWHNESRKLNKSLTLLRNR